MSILEKNFGQQQQLDDFATQLIPATGFEAAKASFQLGIPESITGVFLGQTQTDVQSQVLSAAELNELFGDLVEVPFSNPMQIDDARRIARASAKERELRAVVALGPQDFIQLGAQIEARLDIPGNNIISDFVEGALNFPIDLINLVGINPLSQNAISLGEDLVLTSMLGPAFKVGSRAIVKPLLTKLAAMNPLMAGAKRIASSSKFAQLGRFTTANLTADLTVGALQAQAQSISQRDLRKEVTFAENLSRAFAGVAFMRLARLGVQKGGNYLDSKVNKQLVQNTLALESNKSPDALNILEERRTIKRLLPRIPSDKPFVPIDFNTIDRKSLPNQRFFSGIIGGDRIELGRYLGEGTYLTDSDSVANGMAVDPSKIAKGKVFEFSLNENVKILDLDKRIDPKLAKALIGDDAKINKIIKDSNTMGEAFIKIRDLDKTLKGSDLNTTGLINKFAQDIRNRGFDGMRITGGFDHLKINPEMRGIAHNVVMMFDVDKSTNIKSVKSVDQKAINKLTMQEVDDVTGQYTSSKSDLDFDTHMEFADQTLKTPTVFQTTDQIINEGKVRADNIVSGLERSLEEIDPSLKKAFEKEIDNVKESFKIEEAEQKLIDDLIGCGK